MIKLVNLVYDEDLESKYPLQMLVNCIENGYKLEYKFQEGDIVTVNNRKEVYAITNVEGEYFKIDTGSIYPPSKLTLVCKAENREDK